MTHANAPMIQDPDPESTVEERIREILGRMTLEEKIGQLSLVNGTGGHVADFMRRDIAEGRVGAVLNEVDVATVNELQRVAVEESRLGIPLLIGRDVIAPRERVFIRFFLRNTPEPCFFERRCGQFRRFGGSCFPSGDARFCYTQH